MRGKIMEIKSVKSKEFEKYGKIIDIDTTDIVKYLEEKTSVPDEGNMYVAGVDDFLALEVSQKLMKEGFGELPMQAGYCNGRGNKLNGLEYHTTSEIFTAGTDLVLILGERKDIVDRKYDTAKCELFKVEKGTCLEVYATTLHFAPCRVGEFFKASIFLPLGTNLPLAGEYDDKMLKAVNKWLLIHEENEQGKKNGAYVGLVGENITVEV